MDVLQEKLKKMEMNIPSSSNQHSARLSAFRLWLRNKLELVEMIEQTTQYISEVNAEKDYQLNGPPENSDIREAGVHDDGVRYIIKKSRDCSWKFPSDDVGYLPDLKTAVQLAKEGLPAFSFYLQRAMSNYYKTWGEILRDKKTGAATQVYQEALSSFASRWTEPSDSLDVLISPDLRYKSNSGIGHMTLSSDNGEVIDDHYGFGIDNMINGKSNPRMGMFGPEHGYIHVRYYPDTKELVLFRSAQDIKFAEIRIPDMTRNCLEHLHFKVQQAGLNELKDAIYELRRGLN